MTAALETTTKPVMFSHSCARALVNHPRNVPDDVLRQLATNGGVCMVAFVPQFVDEDYRSWDAAGSVGDKPWSPRVRSRTTSSTPWEVPASSTSASAVTSTAVRTSCCRTSAMCSMSRWLLTELADRGWSDAELMQLTGRNALRVLADSAS